MRRAPHLALLGAFHFPVPQGSQVFAAEQGRALAAAGARVTLLAYGGRDPGAARWPFELVQTPGWAAPASHGAGPRLRKPLADAALLQRLITRQRVDPFDAVLAHNAEAALVALLARRTLRVPVVYVAHTLLGVELAAYGPSLLAPLAESLGRRVDRELARRADGAVALCDHTRQELARFALGPVARIPPGLEPAAAPDPQEIAKACAAHDLAPGGYALYAGNLDAYQDVEVLSEVAARLPEIPLVVASHATPGRPLPHLRAVRLGSAAEARALTFGAAVGLCPRRVCPGFPIKLLNYMEASLPILAREGVGSTLRHSRDAWLVGRDAEPAAVALALRTLWDDAELRQRLGAAARETLASAHAWPALARHTLDLLRSAGAAL